MFQRKSSRTNSSSDIKLSDDIVDNKREYWRQKLANLASATNIIKLPERPKMLAENEVQTALNFTLNGKLLADIKHKFEMTYPHLAVAIEHILSAAVYSLMSRYNCTSAVSRESNPQERNLADILLHVASGSTPTLPLRIQFLINETFASILKLVITDYEEAKKYQLPLAEISHALPDENYLRFTQDKQPNLLLCINQSLDSLDPMLKNMFNIKLNQDIEGNYSGVLDHSALDSNQLARMASHIENILRHAANNLNIPTSDIALQDKTEIALMNDFNKTELQCAPEQMTITDILHKLSQDYPDLPFLAFHPQQSPVISLTYLEFDKYTSQIANYLRDKHGLVPGDLVAVSLARSIHLPAFCFGVIKAGLVLVPLETKFDRLFEHKVSRSKAKLFVVNDDSSQAILQARPTANTININSELVTEALRATSTEYRRPDLGPNSPIYDEHSSATTTGVPKGIVISHSAFLNMCLDLGKRQYPEKKGVLCMHPPTFDAFLYDFLAAIATKGFVLITSDTERLSTEAVERIIRSNNVFLLVCIPEFLSKLSKDLPLDVIISMGSSSHPQDLNARLALNPKLIVENGYGPTETCIQLTKQIYSPGIDANLIGKPVANMKVYIVDARTFSLCPIGCYGEMVAAGKGLAIGYVDNPTLTNEKFIFRKYDPSRQKFIECDPLDKDGVRLYKTGDIGRYQLCEDNSLALRLGGRSDRQVKLCGVAINLDSVEDYIRKITYVKDVSVIINKDENALFAYVVTKHTMLDRDVQAIVWAYLKSTPLPPVAYPICLFMTKLPVTPHGKIDYKRLLELREPIPPQPDMEQPLINTITMMWKDTLRYDANTHLDVHTSFYHMGGNSMALAGLQNYLNSIPILQARHYRIAISEKLFNGDMTITQMTNALAPILSKQETPSYSSTGSLTTFSFGGKRAIMGPIQSQSPPRDSNALDLRVQTNSKKK